MGTTEKAYKVRSMAREKVPGFGQSISSKQLKSIDGINLNDEVSLKEISSQIGGFIVDGNIEEENAPSNIAFQIQKLFPNGASGTYEIFVNPERVFYRITAKPGNKENNSKGNPYQEYLIDAGRVVQSMKRIPKFSVN